MQTIHKNIFIVLILLQTGCKKNIEVSAPPTSLNTANVYATDATAAAVLTGIYTSMSLGSSASVFTGQNSISLGAGLSADEFTLWSGQANSPFPGEYQNALSANSGFPPFWTSLYNYIYRANAAIEGLSESTTLIPATQKQLLGEAKFLRAFYYFYLVNLYGDVPLAVTTDYNVNSLLAKSPKAQVWQQIIADLKDAQELLTNGYVDAGASISTAERVRPNKWAATALLARAYLYTGDWANAEAQSTAVINNSTTYSLVSDPNNVFKKNSTEAIWQLQPVNTGWNTEDARAFIILSTGFTAQQFVYVSNNLLTSFETGDQRSAKWTKSIVLNVNGVPTTYYYPFKYQSATSGAAVTEYLMMLRLGEQFLIRAEARAQQGNTSAAASDLNMIRNRAGLGNTTASTQTALLTAILHERQVELFSEWGHRWLDLKRTNTVDAVMNIVTPQKGGSWNTNWQWYPIPFGDIQKDPNLIQNGGY